MQCLGRERLPLSSDQLGYFVTGKNSNTTLFIFNIAMIHIICNMHVYICKPANKTVTLSNEVEEHFTFFHMI